MDARLRSSLYEEAHGSPLYTAPRKNINPSTSGDRIQEEIAELTKWVNQQLGAGGYTEQLVTDLGLDMADGITLLHLVQALAKEDLPKHFPNPIMRVQKLENLQVCLKYLQQKGLSVTGIHANDIAGGNMKTILAICHALRRFFTGVKSPKVNGSHLGVSSIHPSSSSSPSSFSIVEGQNGGSINFSSLDREDVALLGWLGDIVHRDIPNYALLYDGKILCDFANEIKSGAVSELDIISGSASERLQIAFNAIESCLFVRPHNLSIDRVASGYEDTKLRHFLHSCRSVHQQMIEMKKRTGSSGGGKKRGEAGRKTDGQKRRSGTTSPTKMNREEVFESLRSSTRSQPPVASLEQREKAKVEARSLEALRQQRKNGNPSSVSPPGESRKKGGMNPGERRSGPGMGSTRLSSSTDSLPSATRLTPGPLASMSKSRSGQSWGGLHGSHDRLPQQQNQGYLPQQIRPFSEIYISGDPSFSFAGQDLGVGGGAQLNKLIELPLSPEDWELDGAAGRATHDTALSLSQPDHSRPFPSPPHPPPPSTLSHSLSRSVDHGLDPPPPPPGAKRQLSTPSPQHHSSLNPSPRPPEKTSLKSPGSSYTLPRTKKQSLSLSPPSSPTPPPPPVIPPPSSMTSVNQPTFVPLGGGGGRVGRKLPPAYPVSKSDSMAAEINDLHDRIALLSNQILYEKADVYTRLHRAVIRERRKRQVVERQLREFTTLARRLTRHYDNLFVQLGREVAVLREEVVSRNGGGSEAEREGEVENRFGSGSGNRLYLTREIDQLREQVSKLVKQQDLHRSHSSLPDSTQPHPEHLFLRKRANSDASLHGPFMKGPLSSFRKVSKFFGEEPPRLETIATFLEGLGYSHLLPIFTVHQITLTELHQMTASHLEILGIPLGPRVRIMSELTKLEPLDHHSDTV